MARMVKCQHCEEKNVEWSDRFELMEIVDKSAEKGKAKNEYYHKGDCYERYLKRQEFIAQEQKEKDELNVFVKGVHNVKYQLPSTFWEMVNDLRNGTNRYEKFWKKKYKQGVPYHVIKEAYRLALSDVNWARLNKKFPKLENELRYCIVIVQNRINDAYKKLKYNEQSQEMQEAIEKKQLENMFDDRTVEFKKKKSEHDISHILGDD